MRRGRWWKPRRRRPSTASSISAAAAAWPSATSWKRYATSSILPCPWGSAPFRTGPIRSCTSRPTSRGSARPPGGGRTPASPTAWRQPGSGRASHAPTTALPGVDVSTGSLGHGLSIASGMALAAKRERSPARVFVVLSDGELDEGSTWEAVLFAAHHRLDNLVAMVDYNKIQSFGRVAEVLDLDPLADKWRAFRWGVREIEGQDHATIAAALESVPLEAGRPSVLVAHTVKGKGVSFMENDLAWHYKSPDAQQLARALDELEAAP